MNFMEQIRRAIFGPPKRRRRRSVPKRKAGKKKVAFYVKEGYTQDELRELVKRGRARVKPHRKG